MALPQVEAEYDIIFAGGGVAASVAASRLAAESDLRILILESGPWTKDKIEHIQPAQYLSHLAPTTTTATLNVAKPSTFLGGRSAIVPTGRCVGGGSSINFMVYNRPAASDFDDWEVKFNNPGWGAKELIPLLRDIETYEVDPDAPTHGKSGPLRVSWGGHFSDAGRQFLDVGPRYDKRRPLGNDCSVFDAASMNIFTRWPKWIGTHGRRSDVPHHFLYNQTKGNINITHGARVKRVLLEDGVATGVEFIFGKDVHPGVEQSVHSVRAAKLVVVSAGALGSPVILERSGIGKPDILKAAGVSPIIDLPGVGTNYQDHLFGVVPYLSDPGLETYDAIWRGEKDALASPSEQWAQDGTGMMAGTGIDAAIKMRPYEDELKDFGPEFLLYWKENFANSPDKPVLTIAPVAGLPGDQTNLPPLKFLTACYFTAYPAGRGSVHITSNDVYTPPDFDAGFLSHPSDLPVLRWGYKKSREYVRRMPLFRGAFAPVAPEFARDSPAALTDVLPVALDAPDIVYAKADDDAIDEFHRKYVATTWHSAGTCAMKPLDQGGVVDPRLNVYGVRNLKVADISIIPSNVHSNTYSSALVIGAKAALIIAEDLGLEGRKADE